MSSTPSDSAASPVLCTPAWLMKGITTSIPAVLAFDGTRLILETDDGKDGFDASIDEVREIKYPWYYFGGGFKAKINGNPVRVSLVKPNDGTYVASKVGPKIGDLLKNASERFGDLGEASKVLGAMATVFDSATSISVGRANMKAWKRVFTEYFLRG